MIRGCKLLTSGKCTEQDCNSVLGQLPILGGVSFGHKRSGWEGALEKPSLVTVVNLHKLVPLTDVREALYPLLNSGFFNFCGFTT